MSKNEKRNFGAIIFALFLIINPNVNVVDILPDFIGYIIILRAISDATFTTPYFPEAKTYLSRLMWLSVLRIPAFIIMITVRGENAADGDIVVLMTLIFAVAEALLIIFAISNVFAGLFYMGERTDAPGLVSDFAVSRTRRISVQSFKNMAYFFAISKTALNFLPELLRLTHTVEIGSAEYVGSTSAFYPPVLLVSFLSSMILGIIFVIYAKKYARAASMDFSRAVSIMYEYNTADTDNKRKTSRIQRAAVFLMIASLFSVELVFVEFHSVNILPHCVYGIFLCIGIYLSLGATSYGKKRAISALPIVFGSAYSVVSLAALATMISFLSEYTYQDLLLGDFVMKKYLPVIILSALELLLLLALVVTGAIVNRKFVLENTGVSVNDDCYNVADRDFHRSLSLRGFLLYGLAALSGISKFVQIMLNFNVNIIFTPENDFMNETAIITTSIPWWGMVVFALACAYIIYSFVYYSTIKEEVEYKYER